jgi:hypothetical protein
VSKKATEQKNDAEVRALYEKCSKEADRHIKIITVKDQVRYRHRQHDHTRDSGVRHQYLGLHHKGLDSRVYFRERRPKLSTPQDAQGIDSWCCLD